MTAVCGKMSVAHFHTPIVFQWACRCGGYSPWLPGSPHHTWTLLGHGNGWLCGVVCVCVFEGQNESSCGFFSLFTFFFMQNFCRELSCTILAIAASRKQPVSAHGTTHLSTARGTQAILLPSDLHLLLNDKLKTSKQRMQTRRPMLIPQQTHSLICLLTVLFIPLRFEPTEWLTKPTVISFCFPWRGIRFFFSCVWM